MNNHSGYSTYTRSKTRPILRESRYPTGWAGKRTFTQIADDLSPIVTRLLRRYYTRGQDIPDSLQTGLMCLWERLVENPALLADTSLLKAAYRVLAISKCTTLNKRRQRVIPFSVLEGDSDYDMDEYGIGGLSTPSEWWNSAEHWATWATKMDARLDFQAALTAIAEEYADDIKGLVALYILTTSADKMATIKTHRLGHSMVYLRMAAIQRKLQILLADYAPGRHMTWQQRYRSGDIAPLQRIRAKYQDVAIALRAIDTLTNGEKLRRIATSERERKQLMYYRWKCGKQIAQAYRQSGGGQQWAN